jgi:hypothetical protein
MHKCVYKHVYIRIYLNTSVSICVYIYTSICMHVCLCLCVCVCVLWGLSSLSSTGTRPDLLQCVCVCVCVCFCVCVLADGEMDKLLLNDLKKAQPCEIVMEVRILNSENSAYIADMHTHTYMHTTCMHLNSFSWYVCIYEGLCLYVCIWIVHLDSLPFESIDTMYAYV